MSLFEHSAEVVAGTAAFVGELGEVPMMQWVGDDAAQGVAHGSGFIGGGRIGMADAAYSG